MNHAFSYVNKQIAETECKQCGYKYQFHTRYLGADRNQTWWLCASCKMQPAKTIRYGDEVCFPWQGDFDDELLICLDKKGNPYKVGKRTCGHADCVKAEHIISQESH